MSLSERQSFISLLHDARSDEFLKSKSFLRVLECIIGNFNHSDIRFMIVDILKRFRTLINLREGYFLLRVLVKSAKSRPTQMMIIEAIRDNYNEASNSKNGSLLLQNLIYSFLCTQFSYTKSCSDHVYNEEESKLLLKDDQSNPALQLLFMILIDNINGWGTKHIKPVVNCAIKEGGKLFEDVFIIKLDSPKVISLIAHSKYMFSYLRTITNHFSPQNISRVYSLIKFNEEHLGSSDLWYFNKIYKSSWNEAYLLDDDQNNSDEHTQEESIISNPNEVLFDIKLKANYCFSNDRSSNPENHLRDSDVLQLK